MPIYTKTYEDKGGQRGSYGPPGFDVGVEVRGEVSAPFADNDMRNCMILLNAIERAGRSANMFGGRTPG